MTRSRIATLPAFVRGSRDLHAIVETPRTSRCKFTYDEKLDLFRLGSVLPAGMYFPYDFGFVPSTLAQDGDPLDVLLLMDEATFTGCLVEARAVGVIAVQQTEDGRTVRNDRLIAVAREAPKYASVRSIHDIDGALLKQIETFFVGYNAQRGKLVEPIGRHGPPLALRMVRLAVERRKKRDRRKK